MTFQSLGDPTREDGPSVEFCLYDGNGGGLLGFDLVMESLVPAGGRCDGKSCWKALPGKRKGFLYRDRSGGNDGITKVLLKAGDNSARVQVKGRGTRLNPPTLPLAESPSVVAQIRTSLGICISNEFAAPARVNRDTLFKAKLP